MWVYFKLVELDWGLGQVQVQIDVCVFKVQMKFGEILCIIELVLIQNFLLFFFLMENNFIKYLRRFFSYEEDVSVVRGFSYVYFLGCIVDFVISEIRQVFFSDVSVFFIFREIFFSLFQWFFSVGWFTDWLYQNYLGKFIRNLVFGFYFRIMN